MSTFFNRPGVQFSATAIAAGAVTAGAIFSYQALRRSEAISDLKSSIPELGRGHESRKVSAFSYSIEGTSRCSGRGR